MLSLGEIIRQQRLMMSLTQGELAKKSGVSPSHLGRIEKGERFPSARILRRIAGPLGFDENELFALAGYLSSPSPGIAEGGASYVGSGRLDPYVGKVLSQEAVEVQRAVIGVLSLLKGIAKGIPQERPKD